MNERKRRKQGKKNWKNKTVDEIIDFETIPSATDAYFATNIRQLGRKFPELPREDISYISGKILNFREVEKIIESYIFINKLASENQDVPLTIDNHLETYTVLKSSDELLDWKETVSSLAKTTYSHNLHLMHSFEIAKLLNSSTLVSSFLDFYKENKNLNLNEQIYLFKKSFLEEEIKTPFDLEQEKHKYPLDVLMQESYRDDPRDSSHFFEHVLSRLDRD